MADILHEKCDEQEFARQTEKTLNEITNTVWIIFPKGSKTHIAIENTKEEALKFLAGADLSRYDIREIKQPRFTPEAMAAGETPNPAE